MRAREMHPHQAEQTCPRLACEERPEPVNLIHRTPEDDWARIAAGVRLAVGCTAMVVALAAVGVFAGVVVAFVRGVL